MKLSEYVGKYVKVDLINGFYYEGKVTYADENSIGLKDKTGKSVAIKEEQITFIREVER